MLLDLRSLEEAADDGSISASGSFILSASELAATAEVPVVATDDDSRRWFRRREHAVASLEGMRLRVQRSPQSSVSAPATATVEGFRLRSSVGSVGVRGASNARTGPGQVRGTVGAVRVSATVEVRTVQSRSTISLRSPSSAAFVAAPARGSRGALRMGRVNVEIGPDLVALEDEEMLMLLELV